MTKYDINYSQGLYQSGSNNHVLLNKLPQNSITVSDIKTWHRRWLGNVYEWAGDERSVNMSKGDLQFSTAAQIPRLLNQFELDCLNRYTPCNNFDNESLIEAIAVIHIEFILIHPFREGNGRLLHLLADVMAAQAGLQPLDYTSWDQSKDEYFSAIQQGMGMNYEPMKARVRRAIDVS